MIKSFEKEVMISLIVLIIIIISTFGILNFININNKYKDVRIVKKYVELGQSLEPSYPWRITSIQHKIRKITDKKFGSNTYSDDVNIEINSKSICAFPNSTTYVVNGFEDPSEVDVFNKKNVDFYSSDFSTKEDRLIVPGDNHKILNCFGAGIYPSGELTSQLVILRHVKSKGYIEYIYR